MPDSVSEAGGDGLGLARRILEETGVACSPGVGFGKESGKWLRFALVLSEEKLALVYCSDCFLVKKFKSCYKQALFLSFLNIGAAHWAFRDNNGRSGT